MNEMKKKTLALILASVLALSGTAWAFNLGDLIGVVGGGFVVTDGDALDARASLPYREKIGAERSDVVLDAQKIDSGNLLTTSQVNALDVERTWSVENTDDDVDNTTPYATWPVKRFSDPDPLKGLVPAALLAWAQ